MKILITGGTGFIGTAITRDLLEKGHNVVATGTFLRTDIVTHDRFRFIQANTAREGPWQAELEDVDGVINLAGRNITLVAGILDDKPYAAMLQSLLPVCRRAILTRPKQLVEARANFRFQASCRRSHMPRDRIRGLR